MRNTHSSSLVLLFFPGLLACSGSDQISPAAGGVPGFGGNAAAAVGGSGTSANQGGVSAPGGSLAASGGRAALGGGGRDSIGGFTANGAASALGGAQSSGGASAVGGDNLGGASAGRNAGSGGSPTAAAGAKAVGGVANGGNKAAGGITAAGGKAIGGTTAGLGGVATGGVGIGGATGGVGFGGAAGAGPDVVPCATNQIAVCTGTNPITCDFGGNPGDYAVTLDLGGTSAGDMYVEAESYRRMLAPLKTAAGETKRFAFGVNVRSPEGQPVQAVSAGTPGLQLYIRGNTPKLSAICAKPLAPLPKLWIAGDSTVCDQDGTDYAGWAQHLPQFLTLPVSVANYADSGESSATVLNSAKMWGAIKAGWKTGDWVMVQVGHNDKDITAAAFQTNITAYVTQAKAAGVNIVLCTPISRVGYTLAAEHVNSTGANLPQIIRDVGKTQNVPVIDLTVTTWNWLQTVTWTQYFALGTDHTHTNPAGATVIAGFVRDAVRSQNLGLAPYLR